VKFLLLGANGQLGQTFVTQGGLAARGELVVTSRSGDASAGVRGVPLDLADVDALVALLDRERPDVIVNAAAYTAVDKAESDEAAAARVNADVPAALGTWAAGHQALVVHYSTDYVFPGDAEAPYKPGAPTGPMGAYGRTKLAGEQALRDSGAGHMIFRTAWVYSPVGHNFLKTMLRLGADRDELRVVADQRGTPTTTTLIVDATLAAIDAWTASTHRESLAGTYHLTASGETTWHGFAEAIFASAVQAGLLPRAPAVHAIGSADFPTPAKRPAYSVLDNRGFTQAFGHPLPDWRAGLDDTIRALSGH
jgi:dTDP-4-dehydrorhamnose reductase